MAEAYHPQEVMHFGCILIRWVNMPPGPKKSHTLKYLVGTPLQWLVNVFIPVHIQYKYLIITGESAPLVQCVNDILLF